MKKVNFKKRVSQLMAGVFGLALIGGVMLSSQEVDAQTIVIAPEIDAFGGNKIPCASQIDSHPTKRVVECSTCSMVPGESDGMLNGQCKAKRK